MHRKGFTYILTNRNHTVLYVGVTSNLPKRMHEHKTGKYKNSFTHRYNVTELVYFEEYSRTMPVNVRRFAPLAKERQRLAERLNNNLMKGTLETLPASIYGDSSTKSALV